MVFVQCTIEQKAERPKEMMTDCNIRKLFLRDVIVEITDKVEQHKATKGSIQTEH